MHTCKFKMRVWYPANREFKYVLDATAFNLVLRVLRRNEQFLLKNHKVVKCRVNVWFAMHGYEDQHALHPDFMPFKETSWLMVRPGASSSNGSTPPDLNVTCSNAIICAGNWDIVKLMHNEKDNALMCVLHKKSDVHHWPKNEPSEIESGAPEHDEDTEPLIIHIDNNTLSAHRKRRVLVEEDDIEHQHQHRLRKSKKRKKFERNIFIS